MTKGKNTALTILAIALMWGAAQVVPDVYKYFSPDSKSEQTIKEDEDNIVTKSKTAEDIGLEYLKKSVSKDEKIFRKGRYAGLIDHESKFDSLAVSKTGALSYMQINILAGQELGLENLYLPEKFFSEQNGFMKFKDKSWELRLEYGKELKELVENTDHKTLRKIDARADPKTNIQTGIKLYEKYHGVVSKYVKDDIEAENITLIAYNLGITNVRNKFLKKDVKTAESILDKLDDFSDIGPRKAEEVRNFYNKVTDLTYEYIDKLSR